MVAGTKMYHTQNLGFGSVGMEIPWIAVSGSQPSTSIRYLKENVYRYVSPNQKKNLCSDNKYLTVSVVLTYILGNLFC